jgi:putative acetyltransferase
LSELRVPERAEGSRESRERVEMSDRTARLPIHIRPEQPADRARVHQIVAAAFDHEAEAELVDHLRGRVSPAISLVAVGEDDALLGHIFFSPVLVGRAERRAMGLAPVAVDPKCQRRAIGSELCRRGLETCLEIDEPVVFVLGHPSYYPRFGFEPARQHGLYYLNENYDPAFFVSSLSRGALDGFEGEVRYDPAFYESA